MKKVFVISVLCLVFVLIYLFYNPLEREKQTIDLMYVTFACECANWIPTDKVQYLNNPSLDLSDYSIFIEPAYTNLVLPDTLGYNGDIIRFTGQFYLRKGFPKGYKSVQFPDKAHVFRYTEYKVIKSNHQIIQENLKDLDKSL